MNGEEVTAHSLLSEDDLFWFNEGTHRRLGQKMGARVLGAAAGTFFAVWAPSPGRSR